MKKYAAVLLICLLACLCFASCSDNAGSVTSGDSQPLGEQSESGEAEDDIPEDSNEEEGEKKPVDDVETKIEAMKEIKNIKEHSIKMIYDCFTFFNENDLLDVVKGVKAIGLDWVILENDDPVPTGLEDITRSYKWLKENF